jgi:hypothetical protein
MSEAVKYLGKQSPELGTELPVLTQNQLGIIKELKNNNFVRAWTNLVGKFVVAWSLVDPSVEWITIDHLCTLCHSLKIPQPSGSPIQVALQKGFIVSRELQRGKKALYKMSSDLSTFLETDPTAEDLLSHLDG